MIQRCRADAISPMDKVSVLLANATNPGWQHLSHNQKYRPDIDGPRGSDFDGVIMSAQWIPEASQFGGGTRPCSGNFNWFLIGAAIIQPSKIEDISGA